MELLRKLPSRLAADHLVRNSLYLILSSGLQAALGFAFWIITARLFSLSDVGRASALISAAILMAYLALLGLPESHAILRALPAPHFSFFRRQFLEQNSLFPLGCYPRF